MITFRIAQEQDLQQILNTYNATIPTRMSTADLEPQSLEERKKWFQKHQNKNRPAWVIEWNGMYAGWLSFSNFYGRPAYEATVEFSLYIEKEHQGKGIGSAAIVFALDKAIALNIKSLLAYVFSHNLPSVRLFEKSGFQVWGHFPGVANMDGTERDLLIFGRKTGFTN